MPAAWAPGGHMQCPCCHKPRVPTGPTEGLSSPEKRPLCATRLSLCCPASSAMQCLQAALTLPGCGSAPLTLKATDSSPGV